MALATPLQIIIIRHAEKPDGKSEDLSPAGFQRAEALKRIFEIHPELIKNKGLDFIFSAKYVPGESSRRSYQTVLPLANSLKLPVNSPSMTDDYADVADEILRNPIYDGSSIFIAWTHSNIPGLAKALGSAPKKKWDSNVYDRMWILRFDDQGRVRSEDIAQRLMPGDSN